MTNLKNQNEQPTGLMKKQADTLVLETILGQYQPASSDDSNIELLSTMEIIDKFDAIATLDKNHMANELAGAGFKLYEIAGEYRWMMKEINS